MTTKRPVGRPSTGGKRIQIIISAEAHEYLKATGNVSQTIEKLAREQMNMQRAMETDGEVETPNCDKCGSSALETQTDGHCNAHGETNSATTTVTTFCRECGAMVKQVTYVTTGGEQTITTFIPE